MKKIPVKSPVGMLYFLVENNMKQIKHTVIHKAYEVALTSDVKRSKIAAILYTTSGHILAAASNKAYWGYGSIYTIHAEQFLIAKIIRMKLISRHRLNDLNIFVCRVMANGKFSNAKPCSKCQALLLEAGLTNVFHTDDNGNIREM
jgi:cytidine deaminase